MRAPCLLLILLLLSGPPDTMADEEAPLFRVGSKKFTESVILGELAAQLARSRSFHAEHLRDALPQRRKASPQQLRQCEDHGPDGGCQPTESHSESAE